MKLLAHLDPVVLERELLGRIDASHASRGDASTLVITPTKLLADHVELRLSRVRPAWIGVEVLQLRALALKILAESGARIPRLSSARVRRALLQRELERRRDRPWGRFVARRPSAAGRLMAALENLREAGLAPEQVDACAASERQRDLAELFRCYFAELTRAEDRGLVDEAGLVRAALPHATDFARRRETIYLHGAYELSGIYLDLLRAMDRGTTVVALIPAALGSRVSRHAEEFARRFLLAPGEEIEALVGPGDVGERPELSALYDEESRPPPSGPAFSFRHAQGPAAEVRIAVREALEAVRRGCPPREIVIAARNAETYAAAVEEAFEDDPLPWASSFSGPLRRWPVVHDFLLLLQVLIDDFPRRPTAELLRSPRVDWAALLAGATSIAGDAADPWSRRARILGGLEEWTDDLPRWAAQPSTYPGQSDDEREEQQRRAEVRGEQAQRFGRLLTRLRHVVAPSDERSWTEHASVLRTVLGDLFGSGESHDPPSHGAADALRGLLDEMEQLDRLAPGSPVSLAEVRRWLEAAVDESRAPLRDGDDGGIRVLDAMQLRGLTFRRAHVLGMNSGVFPAPPREDPVLDDGIRRRLVEHSGRPLSIKSRGIGEERLLLVAMLGCAREHVEVSWQRADESGKARTPSLALREISRLAFGRPDIGAVNRVARHLPSHPAHWLEALQGTPGLLSDAEELLLAALRGSGSNGFAELERRDPGLAPGLAMLAATQAFTTRDPAYDARIGPLPGPPDLSVSALETLGLCPLKFFFDRVLRVRELDEAASAIEIPARDLGSRVHELLERVYRELALDDPPTPERLPSLLDAARALLAGERERMAGDLGARISSRLPVLWAWLSESWFNALQAFVESDLTSLVEGGWRVAGLEEPRAVEIDLGGDARLGLHGRFDRRLERDGASLIGDYKTSGKLGDRCSVTNMLKGRRLQVPLYHLLGGGSTRVELLGVGPAYADGEETRASFAGFADDGERAAFLESLGVLADLWARGLFPLHADSHCDWCAYRQACRRSHPPTKEREELARDAGDYALLRKKARSGKATLDAVRAKEGGAR